MQYISTSTSTTIGVRSMWRFTSYWAQWGAGRRM